MVKKIHALTMAMAGSAVVLTGCQYPNGQTNNTGTAALIGGGFGAAAGALLGGRNAAAGALIGGAFGAITGAIIGNQMDREQAERLREEAPDTYARVEQGRPLMVSDVEALARAHVSDDAIIGQIQNTHTIYHLSPTDIVNLHTAGVSDKVVNYMINTASLPAPPPPPPPIVVQSDDPPAPPPDQPPAVSPGPGYVWVSGEWQSSSEGWVWSPGQWAFPPWPGAVWVPGYWYRGPISGWQHAPGHWH